MMTFDTVRLIVFSIIFCFIGYIIGFMRNLWMLKKAFPDLYDELKRRCEE